MGERLKEIVPFAKGVESKILDGKGEFRVRITFKNGHEVVLPGELNEYVGKEVFGVKENGSRVILLPEVF